MDIYTIASNAVEVLARRLAAGPDGPDESGAEPAAAAQVEAMIRQTAETWSHIGPLLQRVEEQPEELGRKAVLAAALAEVASENPGFGDALRAATEAASEEPAQDDSEMSDSSIPDSGDRSATITTGRDFRMFRSIFALGSVNNSRRTRINTGIGAMALVFLLGGGVATYQAVRPEKPMQGPIAASTPDPSDNQTTNPRGSQATAGSAPSVGEPSARERLLGAWECNYEVEVSVTNDEITSHNDKITGCSGDTFTFLMDETLIINGEIRSYRILPTLKDATYNGTPVVVYLLGVGQRLGEVGFEFWFQSDGSLYLSRSGIVSHFSRAP